MFFPLQKENTVTHAQVPSTHLTPEYVEHVIRKTQKRNFLNVFTGGLWKPLGCMLCT